MRTYKDLIIFAAKHVGSEILKFLWEDDPSPNARVFVNGDDDEILATTKNLGIHTEVFSPEACRYLTQGEETYGWFLNIWFPHIFKPNVLGLAKHRINVHPGLLPNCRGSDCATWTIRKDLSAGVSLLEMREGVDTGEIYAQRELAYSQSMSGKELQKILLEAVIDLFIQEWPKIRAGKIQAQPQIGRGTTFNRKNTEKDRMRHGHETATLEDTIRWIRAHDFSPDTTAEVNLSGKRYKLSLDIHPIEDA